MAVPKEWLNELRAAREQFDHGDGAITTQEQLDAFEKGWKSRRDKLRPGEKEEDFELVDRVGKPLGIHARRWICHLLGLRHRCAHVLVRWTTPGLGRVLVLQVRSWSKPDSPGHLDISVGGHAVGKLSSEQTAHQEMEEELGISRDFLIGCKLLSRGGYANDLDERPEKNFYNVEWRDVYLADLIPSHFSDLRFNDDEVAGLYLCPELQAKSLLDRKQLPIASALRQFLKTFF